jgi:hypothetical protein
MLDLLHYVGADPEERKLLEIEQEAHRTWVDSFADVRRESEKKDKVIEEKDKVIEEDKKVIEEKDKVIEEQAKAFAALKRQLEEMQRQL